MKVREKNMPTFLIQFFFGVFLHHARNLLTFSRLETWFHTTSIYTPGSGNIQYEFDLICVCVWRSFASTNCVRYGAKNPWQINGGKNIVCMTVYRYCGYPKPRSLAYVYSIKQPFCRSWMVTPYESYGWWYWATAIFIFATLISLLSFTHE